MPEWRLKRAVLIPAVEHSGWLPAGASRPVTTPARTVEVWVAHERDAYYLYTADGEHTFDSRHRTLADAFAQAQHQFGITPDEWSQVNVSPN
jgi:hypothetical protein